MAIRRRLSAVSGKPSPSDTGSDASVIVDGYGPRGGRLPCTSGCLPRPTRSTVADRLARTSRRRMLVSAHVSKPQPVTSFFTGSSAPSARRAAGGAGAPSSRVHPHPHSKRPLHHGTGARNAMAQRPQLHSPPSHRPDAEGSARRHPASRALRVALRWPPATLDPGRRRAGGLVIGSVALFCPDRFRAPPAHPRPIVLGSRRSACTGPDAAVQPGVAFAMRRSGVRIPSAPPDRHRVPPAGTVPFYDQVTVRLSAEACSGDPTGSRKVARHRPARAPDPGRGAAPGQPEEGDALDRPWSLHLDALRRCPLHHQQRHRDLHEVPHTYRPQLRPAKPRPAGDEQDASPAARCERWPPSTRPPAGSR